MLYIKKKKLNNKKKFYNTNFKKGIINFDSTYFKFY